MSVDPISQTNSVIDHLAGAGNRTQHMQDYMHNMHQINEFIRQVTGIGGDVFNESEKMERVESWLRDNDSFQCAWYHRITPKDSPVQRKAENFWKVMKDISKNRNGIEIELRYNDWVRLY